MDTTKQNAKQAVALTTILTLFVAGFELLIAFTKYRAGMNFLDLTTYVTQNKYIYFMLLMIANLALFPAAFLLFKTNGISLKNEICSKKTLGKDILYGIIALAGTEIVGLVSILADKGKTEMAYVMTKPSAEIIILWFISLGLVSGIIKEIFFRGLAKIFAGKVKGDIVAKQGGDASYSGIVISGIVRSFYVDADGNDITQFFSIEGSSCADSGMVGFNEIQATWEALEDSTVMLFEVKEIKKLINENVRLKDFWMKSLESGMRYKIYRENGFLVENATERYLSFRNRYPDLSGRVAQRHIATYLGIAPETLSRIRNSLKE